MHIEVNDEPYYVPPPTADAIGRRYVVLKGIHPGIYVNSSQFQLQIFEVPYADGLSLRDPFMAWDFYEANRAAGRVAALPPKPKPKHVAAEVAVLAADVAALAAGVAAVPSQGAPNVPRNSTATTPVIIDIEDSDDDTVNSDAMESASTDSIEEIGTIEEISTIARVR